MTASAAATALRSRLWQVRSVLRSYGPLLAQWLGLRALIAVVAAWSLYVIPLPGAPEPLHLDPRLIGFEEVVEWLASPRGASFYWLEPLWRWDALAFLAIARDGYRAGELASTAFPPLYPLLVRALQAALPGQWLLSALLVSAAASAASAVLLWQLSRLELGRRADLAPLVLLVSPTAYYLAAPYAESLFLALSLGTLLAARLGRWWLAAALAAAASLTKSHAPALMVPLGLLALGSYRARGGIRAAELAAVLAPLLGPIGVELYSRLWLGDLGPLAQQTGRWGWQLVPPGWTIVEAVRELAMHGVRHAADVFDLPLVVAGLAWLGWGWRRLPPYLAWYALAVLLPGLSRLMAPPLAANTRFLLLAFPIPIAIALWCDRPWRRVVVLSGGLALQLVLLVLFVHWTWVA